jgi:hypothetical protein
MKSTKEVRIMMDLGDVYIQQRFVTLQFANYIFLYTSGSAVDQYLFDRSVMYVTNGKNAMQKKVSKEIFGPPKNKVGKKFLRIKK